MVGLLKRRAPCDNLNHRRTPPPVRYCRKCGVVINDNLGDGQCSDAKHATARSVQSIFCVDCGLRLIAATRRR